MTEKREKFLAAFMMILLITCLFPVMYLGRYNHATGDDYHYGVSARLEWEKNGNLINVIAEAGKGVCREYNQWQGTYSAMFLMYLPPNLFGDSAYRLVTTVILLLLTGSIFYLLKPMICNWLKGSKSLWITIASAIILLCIETVPSQGETFFWYNGSMYYTGYFAVTLFFWGLLIRYLDGKHKWYLPMLLMLAVFLAGGNYVSLLPSLILIFFTTVWLFYKKNTHAWSIGFIMATMFAGFIVSAAAPGNRMRQTEMWKIPAWKAVLKSLLQGINYITAWTGVWYIIFLILITPILWKYLKKCSFRFRYPGLTVGFLYGLFCSMSCPTFYTMNSTGPARVVSIVYYGYILFFFFTYCYLLGYFQKIREKKIKTASNTKISAARFSVAGILILFALQVISGNLYTLTTTKAVHLLSSGEAKAYEKEYQERMNILLDDTVQDAVLPAYQHRPDMLYVGDFSSDLQSPLNQSAAAYFHKKSILVSSP